MSVPTTDRPAGTARPTARRTRALAVLGATAATLAVWLIAVPLAGIDLTARTGAGGPTQDVGPVAVAIVTLLAGLAGWGLLAALERTVRRPRTVWTVVAVAFLVLSLAGPLGSGIGAATKLTLAGMHVAAGAVIIPALARSAADRSARRSEPEVAPGGAA